MTPNHPNQSLQCSHVSGIRVTLRPPVMGLTKQYLRYVASAVFGVIGSQKANISYVTLRGGERGRYVAVAACEQVFIWDTRKAEKVSRICDCDGGEMKDE